VAAQSCRHRTNARGLESQLAVIVDVWKNGSVSITFSSNGIDPTDGTGTPLSTELLKSIRRERRDHHMEPISIAGAPS
jgi:hypothetical protein